MAFPTQILQWVDYFMSRRLISLAFNRQQESQKLVETGIPQGSPTSPILFLLYLAPLFRKLDLKHKAIYKPSYIDDIALVATGKTEEFNIKELEKAAETAFE
jgi:Reverse transcriptase (RNA-dependent DNA polymerase)